MALGSSRRFSVLLTKDISRRIATRLLELRALLSRDTNPRIADVFHEIEGSQWMRRCFDGLKKINFDKRAVLLFARIQAQADGTYRIPYIDPDKNIKHIVTTDASFSNLKQYIGKKTKALNQKNRLPNFLNKNTKDVISTILLCRQAIYLFRHIPKTQASDQLHYAQKIHLTVNQLQLIQGGVQTTESIFQTVRHTLKIATPHFLQKSSTLLKLARLPGRALPVIGLALDTADFGLSAYGLALAVDNRQRIVYGAQLTLSAINVAISAATMTAMFLGATAVVASLSVVAVPLIVVSIAVNHAISSYINYFEIRKGLAGVRQYCDHITQAYDKGGYELASNSSLHPFDGVPIIVLDLQKGSITFGEQRLYRSQQTLRAKIDTAGATEDYIGIRATLGHQLDSRPLPSTWRNAEHLILPAVPSHKMHYVYTAIGNFFAPSIDDRPLIRNSGRNWFPTKIPFRRANSESKGGTKYYVVTAVAIEYLPTTITVTLDNQTRSLHIPATTEQRLTKLTYQFQGSGGEYYLNLQPGISVSLTEQDGNSSSSWVIDASLWQTRYIGMSVFNDRIRIGDRQLLLNAEKIKKILIYDVDKTLGEVDFVAQSIRLMKIDFVEWTKQNPRGNLLSHLNTFSSHQIAGPYLVIEKYPVYHQYDNIPKARAFYDVHHQRILRNCHEELSLLRGPVSGHTYKSLYDRLEERLRSFSVDEGISNMRKNFDFKKWEEFIGLFIKHPLHQLEEIFKQKPDLACMPLMKRFLYMLQRVAVAEFEQEEVYSPDDVFKRPQLGQDEVYELDDEQKKHRCASEIKKITAEHRRVARNFQYVLTWIKRVQQKIDSLNAFSNLIKETELAGVIGNHVYFYNKEKSVVWRADIATGHQQVIFHFLFDSPLIKAWEHNGAIQVEQKWVLADGHTGYICYSIKSDQVSLLAIVGDNAFLSALLSAQQDLQLVQQALKKQVATLTSPYTLALSMHNDHRDTLYWFKSSDSIKEDKVSGCIIYPQAKVVQVSANTSIIPIFGEKEHKAVIRYWLRVSDNLIINPNLHFSVEESSQWSVPQDLVYVGAISQLDKKEIFYFYSAEEKAIYRQEGPGKTHRTSDSQTALRINIPGLLKFFQYDDRFIAVTDEGLIFEIDVVGQSHLLSVNQQWLDKQSTPWWIAARTLAEEKEEISFFIEGLKGIKVDEVPLNDSVQLSAWYEAGYVIVADNALRGKSLGLIYTDYQNQFAYLLDMTDGKLYRQPIAKEEELVTAFGGDSILDVTTVLPCATHVATHLVFKSANAYAHSIRLVSKKGEIFLLDAEEKLSLIGVDQQWQSNYLSAELTQACEELITLAKQNGWLREKALVLQREFNQALAWYDIEHKRIVEAQGLSTSDLPKWIGADTDNNTSYIFSSVKQTLYKINGTHATHLLHLSAVENLSHNQLMITGTDNPDVLTMPCIVGVDQVIYSGGQGADHYQIDLNTWKHYSKILIHNFDAASTPDEDTLDLFVEDEEHLIVYQNNKDLAFCDIKNNRSVNITDVFGDASFAARHMNIKFRKAGEILLEQTIDAFIHELSRYHSSSSGESAQPFAYPLSLFSSMTGSLIVPSAS